MSRKRIEMPDGTVLVHEGWTLRNMWDTFYKTRWCNNARENKVFPTRQTARNAKGPPETVKRVWVEE